MEKNKQEVCVSVRSGGSIVRCRPIFSSNSRLLISASGCIIKIYNVESDTCANTLRHHTADISCIIISPSNQFQILSSSLDQTIILWDYIDGMMLHQFKFKLPVTSIFPSAHDPSRFYGIFHSRKDTTNGDLAQFTLQKQSTGIVPINVIARGLSSDARQCAVGCQQAYIAYVKKGSMVTVFDVKTSASYTIELKLSVKCVACHPTAYIIAAGCKTGKIFLCQNFIGRQSEIVLTTLHWHSLDVVCLSFSTQGSYLLSGGYECVLAKWLTESTLRKPETLPRLSAPIVNISCSNDNQLYAICYIDNGIQMIRSNFTRGLTIQGLVLSHHERHRPLLATGLLYHRQFDSLVLNGRPGQLQFFSVKKNRQLFNLNVVGHNYVSPENLDQPMIPTEVENAAFFENWLCTVERRDDGVTAVEMRLKFWKFHKNNLSFVLNTQVEKPHRGKVNCIKFQRSSSQARIAVTSSSDGMFKVWLFTEEAGIRMKKSMWICSSVGFYRNKPAGQLDFSADKSVLAVAFQDTITLWDPAVNSMNTDVISLPGQQVDIRDVWFGCNNCSHLLLFTTHNSLYSWNLLSFSVQWSLSLTVSTMCMNPCTGLAAVFTRDHHLYVMSPLTAEPVYCYKNVATTPVIGCLFVPHGKPRHDTGALCWQNEAQLHFMTENQEICRFNYGDHLAQHATKNAKLEQHLPPTVLSMFLAERTDSDVKGSRLVSRDEQLARTDQKFVNELLSNPLHGMPPMSVLCMSFINSLLIRKKSTKSGKDSDSEDDVDKAASGAADKSATSSDEDDEKNIEKDEVKVDTAVIHEESDESSDDDDDGDKVETVVEIGASDASSDDEDNVEDKAVAAGKSAGSCDDEDGAVAMMDTL